MVFDINELIAFVEDFDVEDVEDIEIVLLDFTNDELNGFQVGDDQALINEAMEFVDEIAEAIL